MPRHCARDYQGQTTVTRRAGQWHRLNLDWQIQCSHIKSMHFEFNPAKDLANQDKHGVSLGMAAELD
jgi:hypothetical protein